MEADMCNCPFCGNDPYEYVDVGVGGQGVPVAITCCDLGVEYFENDPEREVVTISVGEFYRIGQMMSAMRVLGMNPDIFTQSN
jgi:hypothetical protein